MFNQEAVGKRIRELREKSGKSQEELGTALERSHAAISDIERGKTSLSVKDLSSIANFFGVTINEILAEGEQETSFTQYRDSKDIRPEEKAQADKTTDDFLRYVKGLVKSKQKSRKYDEQSK